MKNISIVTTNDHGFKAAEQTVLDLFRISPDFTINIFYKGTQVTKNRLKVCYVNYLEIDEIVIPAWNKSDAIIWFTSTGIVVRKIAKLLAHKALDPAILVINLDRTQVIPLLSGHIGGANDLAKKLNQVNKRLTPFITTATDSLGILALDTYAINSEFEIENIEKLASISSAMVNNYPINIITFDKIKEDLQKQGLNTENINYYDYYDEDLDKVNKSFPTAVISPIFESSIVDKFESSFNIRIKPIVIGIGLNRGLPFEELYEDFKLFIKYYNISLNDITKIASFEAKRDEEAVNLLAHKLNIELVFFNENEINSLPQDFSNSRAKDFFNIKGVAEPAAVLAAQYKTLFIKKNVYKNTTIAAAF